MQQKNQEEREFEPEIEAEIERERFERLERQHENFQIRMRT